jgi:hypothetical protein
MFLDEINYCDTVASRLQAAAAYLRFHFPVHLVELFSFY